MFVSIVIPVYNVEKYLKRCLDSIISQWDEDTEIILVNDGSSDHSLHICKEYAKRYPRFSVISQENRGVGVARNRGISSASGEYIMLMDADDFYNDQALPLLFDIMHKHKDVDVFRFGSLYAHQYRPGMKMEIGEYLESTAFEHITRFGLVSFCWSMAYKKCFLVENNLSFTTYTLGEDVLFTSQVLFCNPKVLTISSPLYMYDFRQGNTTNTRTKEHEQRGAWDYLHAMQRIVDVAEEKDVPDSVMDSVKNSLNTNMYPVFFLFFYARFTNKEFNQILAECKAYNFLPVRGRGARKFVINAVSRYPFLYGFAMWTFTRIVAPLYMRFRNNP